MRIAREPHDVVAHSMAMINVQATMAGMQLAADPASAAEAIQAIREAGKSGLRELRSILRVLRQADAVSPAVPEPVPDLRATGAFGDGTGAGLAGMRERAAALGGSLVAGPRPGGGFAVQARLPTAGSPPAPVASRP